MDDGRQLDPIDRLRAWFKDAGAVVVALSSGVDSSVLAIVAAQVLGARATAVTGASDSLPADELSDVVALCAARGVQHEVVATHEMADARYLQNGPDRCYFCKDELFAQLSVVAAREGAILVEGTHKDDLSGHRPGRRAAQERAVRAPYVELGLGKEEIRAVARLLGLTNAERPSSPCLSSRIAYGVPVTSARLDRVRAAERALDALGFAERRVRLHALQGGGELARVEVPKRDLARAIDAAPAIDDALRALGFTYATIDLRGLRSGSLLEVFQPSVDADEGRTP